MILKHSNENIFDIAKENEAITITTNGVVKKNGKAVMGAGLAKQANSRYDLDLELGNHLLKNGNIPLIFSKRSKNNSYLISFPTKYSWKDDSNINLIKKSAMYLKEIIDENNIKKCYLVPVGCGLGNLNVSDVIKELNNILDDRFIMLIRKEMEI